MESVDIQYEESAMKNNNSLSLLSPIISKEKEYQYGLDTVRFLAMYLVVSVHATSFHYFLNTKLETFVLFLCGMHRYISYTCCPLFMILTGYLNKEKKVTLAYYSKLINTIFEYLLCSFIVMIFRIKYQKEKLSNEQILNGFFGFYNAPYAWYVNLYVGYFLISPFLNILYNNLHSSKHKYSLIAISIIVFSLPSTYYRFGWGYFLNAYAIMYYFIGCFIKDYQPKVKKFLLIIWIVVVDITQTLIKKYSNKLFVESYNNLGCVILSSSIFLLFYNLKAKRKNCFLKTFRKITDTSLSFFLLSYMFDIIFEINLFKKKNLNNFMKRLPYLFITEHVCFIGSIILGFFTHNISVLVVKVLHHIFDTFNELYKTHNNNNNLDLN